MNRIQLAAAFALATVALACAGQPAEPQIEPLDVPAPVGSGFPSLSASDSGLYLTWIEFETDETVPQVRFSAHTDGAWSEPETIASDSDLFVNWADFPSAISDPSGRVGAQWLVRSGEPSWAYGIRFAMRRQDGSWSDAAIPHGRDYAGEHGFVSAVSMDPGEFELIWLDGRDMQTGPMTLRHSRWADGSFADDEILDGDVCTCCQTDMAAFEDQRFVAYRDHAPGEIRDISYVRFDGASWSAPTKLAVDGWQIAACPVNGPSIGNRGANLGVAWFTQAQDNPRVQVIVSEDFGATFDEPLRIDDGDPIGRVDAAMLEDGSLIVVWIERDGDEAAVRLRRVIDRKPGEAITVGRTAAGRDSGFPRVATDGRQAWVAWTETTRPPRIRLARVDW